MYRISNIITNLFKYLYVKILANTMKKHIVVLNFKAYKIWY